MNDKPSAWEQDASWLLARLPEASDEQLDAFCERVSIIIADMKINEEDARRYAYAGML